MRKITVVSVTYENVAILKKNRVTLLQPSVFPSCMVFEPIYGHSVSFRETGLLSLYILSQGWVASATFRRRVTVSNTFTKRRRDDFKIGIRDRQATHLRQENLISYEIVNYTFFFMIGDFPIQFSVYKMSFTQRIFSLGSLWIAKQGRLRLLFGGVKQQLTY